ncbi:MAG: hypothetical protein ACJ8D0_23150 [Xanthobacteraceae bacterium]
MAISIRIPGLLKLVVARKAAEILAMNAAMGIDRPLSGRGGLFNRAIGNKLKLFQAPTGEIWPAFCSRLDPVRIAHQNEVAAKLADVPAQLRRLSSEIGELAGYVRGKETARPVGMVVQQIVGRVFFDDYRANRESYDAAQTLSAWLKAGPLKTLVMRRSGKVPAAVDAVLTHARGNTACAHGTGIALHNIIESVELMRKLARSETRLRQLSPDEAVAQTLRAPQRAVREARDSVCAGSIRVRERSIILLGVESARKHGSDPGIAFFTGQWNECPAHAFVPALLAEIWKTARA